MKGLLNIYKPKGFTSQDVVSVIRKILSTREVGHMGTLDPQGEGVLLVGIGKGARLFDLMLKKDKVYEAEFDFGYETDTIDGDGVEIARTDIIPSEEDIKQVCNRMIGDCDQIPPKYSAKNINGRRAYDLAREGKEFNLKPCKIKIYDLKLLYKTGENKYMFQIHCSGGTYIRSICRDIAYALNSLATMTSIKRIFCSNFTVKNSITLDELKILGKDAIIPLEKVLEPYTRYDVPDSFYTKLNNGLRPDAPEDLEEPFIVYCKNELFGVGEIIDGKIRVKTYLRD
ncbi:MAG: tRNA pseudouridine(55) synthase TruB [Clostridiales bacterium]|nr:tRNA pseudouridine(55) synthase TruB [Clostridiales bacterium]